MKSKKIDISKYKIPIIIGSILLLLVLFFIAANFLIVFRNDCDSPCRHEKEPTACPAVCIKTEQTLWEAMTGQEPRFVGY